MEIRADLSQPAVVTPEEWQWVASPQAGVTRVMLDRVGDEVAIATSFVRYASGSTFPTHVHALGEEFLVLEGEFGDEHGRYPAGSYIRNPAGTAHAPFSDPGCLIWVKLRQFHLDDQHQFSLPLDTPAPDQGAEECQLHQFQTERVREVSAAVGTTLTLGDSAEVEELLVLEGVLELEGRVLPTWSWVRVPSGQQMQLAVSEPARVFIKTRPVYER